MYTTNLIHWKFSLYKIAKNNTNPHYITWSSEACPVFREERKCCNTSDGRLNGKTERRAGLGN